jgi:uncharacterized protein (DUF58 family)
MPRTLKAFARVYRWSQWADRRFTPAGIGVVYLMIAAGVFGVDAGRTMGFQVFSIAAALLICAWVGAGRWRPALQIERRLPDHATVGVPLTYRLLIRSQSPRATPRLVVRDEFEDRFPTREEFSAAGRRSDPSGNFFDRRVGYPRWVAMVRRLRGGIIDPVTTAALPASGEGIVDIGFVPERRGVVRLARTRVLRPDPLGLINAVATLVRPQSLLVLPKLYDVPAIELPGSRRHHPRGLQAAQQVGESQEFLQLRDYRPGDPIRRLHWPSTARAGRPIVKETSEEFFARYGLVLDTFIVNDDEVAFEAAVSAAASLAARLTLGDALLDLMFVEDRALAVTAGRGIASAHALLRELAEVAPCRDRPFDVLATRVGEHGSRMSACIHVLLAFDAPRREMVRALQVAGVPQIVLVVGSADVDDAGVPVHRIAPDRLAESLASMPTRCR